jgi:hypothetical protein
MTSHEARHILALFRPGTADEQDPFFHEARELVKNDPESNRWFAAHCESYLALRGKFQAVPVPPELKQRILSKQFQARQTLLLFRPGTADERDASFNEARELAKTDPELARWFADHCEAYLALRGKFQSIPVPPGLKEQILAERNIRQPSFQRYWAPLFAMAAVVAVLVGISAGFWPFHDMPDRYAAYRKRMTESALRSYSMDLLSTDPAAIRRFLREKKAPADYSLPAGLNMAAVVGCVVTTWQSNPVSMICFKSGRPLPPGDQSDVWLFVVDRTRIANAPAPGAPLFARVNKATTATWSDADKTYLLAAVGDEAFLRKYLQRDGF